MSEGGAVPSGSLQVSTTSVGMTAECTLSLQAVHPGWQPWLNHRHAKLWQPPAACSSVGKMLAVAPGTPDGFCIRLGGHIRETCAWTEAVRQNRAACIACISWTSGRSGAGGSAVVGFYSE